MRPQSRVEDRRTVLGERIWAIAQGLHFVEGLDPEEQPEFTIDPLTTLDHQEM